MEALKRLRSCLEHKRTALTLFVLKEDNVGICGNDRGDSRIGALRSIRLYLIKCILKGKDILGVKNSNLKLFFLLFAEKNVKIKIRLGDLVLVLGLYVLVGEKYEHPNQKRKNCYNGRNSECRGEEIHARKA